MSSSLIKLALPLLDITFLTPTYHQHLSIYYMRL